MSKKLPRLHSIIKCRKCEEEIQSNGVYDFKYCKCKSIFIDGGYDYCRIGGNSDDIIFLRVEDDNGKVYNKEEVEEINEQRKIYAHKKALEEANKLKQWKATVEVTSNAKSDEYEYIYIDNDLHIVEDDIRLRPMFQLKCVCQDWYTNISEINGILNFAMTHKIVYKGKKFMHCPWCGQKLINKVD